MQDLVRDKLKSIKDNIGIPYSFIANKTGVNYERLRNFMKGRNIPEEELIKLHDYAQDIERRFEN